MTGAMPQKIFSCEFRQKYGICKKGCSVVVHWQADCFDCQGDIKHNCITCKGSGHILYTECPRHLGNKYERLLPYFFSWRAGDFQQWPDGRGMIYQPIKLRAAYNILLWWYQTKEDKERAKKNV
jgi:hypothetical protein